MTSDISSSSIFSVLHGLLSYVNRRYLISLARSFLLVMAQKRSTTAKKAEKVVWSSKLGGMGRGHANHDT